jgi:hypothetical protein
MSNVLTQIAAGKDSWVSVLEPEWPQRCACCNQDNDTTTEIEFEEQDEDGIIIYHRAWQVPYCSHCLQHVQSALSLTSKTFLGPTASLGSVLAIVSSLIFCVLFESVWPLVLTIAAVLAPLAYYKWRGVQQGKKIMKPSCCSVDLAVVCLSHHQYRGDMHTFSFKNPQYAQEFKSLNKGS